MLIKAKRAKPQMDLFTVDPLWVWPIYATLATAVTGRVQDSAKPRRIAKALRRFRCVCKGWCALISDPAFVAAHRSRSGPLIVALFGFAPEHELQLLGKGGKVLRAFDMRGSSVLLAPTRLDLIFVDRAQLGAMIIDPSSGREFTTVGTNDPAQPWWHNWSSPTVNDYSFGRASPSGDYKVLRLRGNYQCEIATILGDGAELTWRRRPWGPFSQTSFSCEHKATVNGDIYFMFCDTYSTSYGRNLIVTFNLEYEGWKLGTIKGPPLGHKEEDDKWCVTLIELKGTLWMVHNVQHLADLGGHYSNIWLLKDPNRSVWVMQYNIQMPERLLFFTKPLDVLIDGTLLLLNTFRNVGNNEKCHRYMLQIYNSSTKAVTDFMEMADGFNGRMAFYSGSLKS